MSVAKYERRDLLIITCKIIYDRNTLYVNGCAFLSLFC